LTDWRDDVIPKVIELLRGYSYKPTVRECFTGSCRKSFYQIRICKRHKTLWGHTWLFHLLRGLCQQSSRWIEKWVLGF